MMVDYSSLKSAVFKSCQKTGKRNNFIVNLNKLTKLVDELGLEPVNNFTCSKRITPEDVFTISLFLRDNKLKWIDDAKEFSIVTLVLQEDIDDRCRELLDKMNTATVDDPEIDKTAIMSELIAKYPCYFVVVVSYKSNEPRNFNLLSYETKCRSNFAVVKKENYGYKKPGDDKEEVVE